MGGSKRAHNKRTNRSKLMSFMEDNPPHPHFSSLPPPPKFLRFRRHWIQPPLLENPAHAHGEEEKTKKMKGKKPLEGKHEKREQTK